MNKKLQYCFILTIITILMVINADHLLASGDVGNAFSSSTTTGGDGMFILALIFFIPFPWNFITYALIIYLSVQGVDKSKTSKVVKHETSIVSNEDIAVSKIKKYDPNFSKYAFLTYAKECLLTIEESVEKKDLTMIKPFTDKNYFNMLSKSIKSDYNFYYQGQEILNATITACDVVDDEIIIIELFVSEYIFAIANDKTVSNKDYGTRKNNVYQIKFKRKKGVKTKDIGLKVTSCPNCGAPNAFDNYGICEYCDSEISTGDYSFILYEMLNVDEKNSTYYRLYHSNRLGALNNEIRVVSEIMEVDPSFDLTIFEAFVKDSFIGVQEAWEQKDLSKIKIYESTDLNNIHTSQITEYIEKKHTPHINDQKIKDIHVNRFEIDGNYEYITVIVVASLKVFVTNELGKVISGDNKLDKKRGYLLRYKRTKGTKSKDMTNSKQCPNCSSEIILSEFGSCEYCGSSILSGEHGWIMDSYEAINRV